MIGIIALKFNFQVLNAIKIYSSSNGSSGKYSRICTLVAIIVSGLQMHCQLIKSIFSGSSIEILDWAARFAHCTTTDIFGMCFKLCARVRPPARTLQRAIAFDVCAHFSLPSREIARHMPYTLLISFIMLLKYNCPMNFQWICIAVNSTEPNYAWENEAIYNAIARPSIGHPRTHTPQSNCSLARTHCSPVMHWRTRFARLLTHCTNAGPGQAASNACSILLLHISGVLECLLGQPCNLDNN